MFVRTVSRLMIQAALLVALVGVAAPIVAQEPMGSEEQRVIDRARAVVDRMRNDPEMVTLNNLIAQSRAVIVFPSLFKLGFFFGGEGGSGVLVSQNPGARWSAPAFYTIGSASFGLQFGIQEAEVVLVIMTENGFNQVLNNQFKLGLNGSVAIGTIGRGIEASTTPNMGADIYAYSNTRGLFGGISLAGSVIQTREEWNANYYGRPATARDIVVDMRVTSPGAAGLQTALGQR
jgi:SH3 domain-containing YSC84-like protein 1